MRSATSGVCNQGDRGRGSGGSPEPLSTSAEPPGSRRAHTEFPDPPEPAHPEPLPTQHLFLPGVSPDKSLREKCAAAGATVQPGRSLTHRTRRTDNALPETLNTPVMFHAWTCETAWRHPFADAMVVLCARLQEPGTPRTSSRRKRMSRLQMRPLQTLRRQI